MEWNRDDENPLVGDNFESIIAEARLAIIDSGDSINFFVDSVNVIDGIGIYPGHIIATHTEWGSNGVAEFGAAVVIKIDDEGNEEDKFIDNILRHGSEEGVIGIFAVGTHGESRFRRAYFKIMTYLLNKGYGMAHLIDSEILSELDKTSVSVLSNRS